MFLKKIIPNYKLFLAGNNIHSVSKFAIPIIDFSFSKPPILGRWKIQDEELAHKTADMTNEDHCGVCDKMRYDYLNKKTY